jgi:hypothetical protein
LLPVAECGHAATSGETRTEKETTMTKNRTLAIPAFGLVAAALLATALPAASCTEATRLLQAEANGSDLYVTRARPSDGRNAPHRPESDIHFPRR